MIVLNKDFLQNPKNFIKGEETNEKIKIINEVIRIFEKNLWARWNNPECYSSFLLEACNKYYEDCKTGCPFFINIISSGNSTRCKLKHEISIINIRNVGIYKTLTWDIVINSAKIVKKQIRKGQC